MNQNICILVNSLACGGAEKVVATLAPEFRKSGLPVKLLCLEHDNFHLPNDDSVQYLSEATADEGHSLGKLFALVPFALRLKRYVSEHQVALVQSHIYRANYINVLARLLGSNHKVQIVNHGMPSQYRGAGVKGKINRWLIRRLYPRADQLVCPSQGMVEELSDMGVPANKLKLIHNPVDIETLRMIAKEEIFPAQFEFNPEKRYFIAIGRLELVKRISDIVRAFANVAKAHENIELIILGDGPERRNVESLAAELEVLGQIHMPGFVVNPYQYLANSDALISASETEGFSIVIVDALALGIPVISTDCKSGPREILAPGSNLERHLTNGETEQTAFGVLVPVGDLESLTKAMNNLLSQGHDEERAIDSKARAEQFNVREITARYLSTIKSLLAA